MAGGARVHGEHGGKLRGAVADTVACAAAGAAGAAAEMVACAAAGAAAGAVACAETAVVVAEAEPVAEIVAGTEE